MKTKDGEECEACKQGERRDAFLYGAAVGHMTSAFAYAAALKELKALGTDSVRKHLATAMSSFFCDACRNRIADLVDEINSAPDPVIQ